MNEVLVEGCKTLHHTATQCNALQHTATHWNTLQTDERITSWSAQQRAHHQYRCHQVDSHAGTAKDCNTLQHTATPCNTLQHTNTCAPAIYVSSDSIVSRYLQHTATATQCERSNTLQQHTATRCDTLQHNAIHCNTLQYTATTCWHDKFCLSYKSKRSSEKLWQFLKKIHVYIYL